MKNTSEIKLYGAARCHKTKYYKELLNEKGISYQFLDVEENEQHAAALRNLYESRRLNFPTITIGAKKLRNPREAELDKWLKKRIT